MESPQTVFEWFLMTTSSARLILVNFSPEKNLTSNRSKPIRVLTRIWSSCSDDRLPNAYLLLDFQPHRSNFVIHFTHHTHTRDQKEGGRHDGGYASFKINLKRLADWFTLDHYSNIYNQPATFSAMFARFQLYAYNLIDYFLMESLFKGHRLSNIKRPLIPIWFLTRLNSSWSSNCIHLCYLLLKSQPIWSNFFLSYEQRLHSEKAF